MESISQQLSGTRLGDFFVNNPATAGLITALNKYNLPKQLEEYSTIADLLSAMRSLSGIPHHPYDRTKYELFGPDYKFKTINDIPKPDVFDVEETAKGIKEVSQTITQTALSGVSALDAFLQKDMSLFTNNIESVIPEDLIRKNFEMTEVIKSLTVEDIKQRPVEIAQKLTSYFIDLYKR